ARPRRVREIHEWIRAADRDGDPAWPLQRKLRAPARPPGQQARRVAHPAARPRPRLPEGAPPDGPGAVDLVPADRSQPSEIRAEHLSGDGGRLREGHAPGVLLRGAAVTHRVAGCALDRFTSREVFVSPRFEQWYRSHEP